MITNDVELKMQRRQTKAMVDADPTSIVLTRRTVVEDGAGGYIEGPPVNLPAQEFNWVTASLPNVRQSVEEGGLSTVTTDLLIGVWNADIQVNDTFTSGEDEYEVFEISATEYKRTAAVRLRKARA